MAVFNIEPISYKLREELKHKIDFKTKPLGALGRLEEVALQIGLIQNTLSPVLVDPHIIVFAGDHGVVEERVSAYSQEVTYQMVLNFLSGGAAINIFCKLHGIRIKVVDAGVKHIFTPHPDLIVSKIGQGTKNFTRGPAMSTRQLYDSLESGKRIVENVRHAGCNVIGFGEMGIGNTTSASALMHVFTGIDIRECVGKGTGVNEESVRYKADVIRNAVRNNENCDTALKKLAVFGGFEIAQMVGAMLKAAELKMIILVDGFIATSAFLAAHSINKNIFEYVIFCHQSEEQGHKRMLEYLKARPIMNLSMRLGEGTGCSVAYPIIRSAVAFLNDMASFESAGVSNKENSPVNA